VFAVAKRAAHSAQVRGFLEQDERNPRSLRVERNPEAGGPSSENRQFNHRNLVKSIAGVKIQANACSDATKLIAIAPVPVQRCR
jgi:hypothetical protein